MKTVAGLIAGLVVALAAIYVIWLIGLQLFPLPTEGEISPSASLRETIRTMSPGTQAFVALSWLGGTFLGATTAAHVSRRIWPAWIVILLVTVSCVANMLVYPHPDWLQLAAIIVPVLGGLVAIHLARRNLSRPMVPHG